MGITLLYQSSYVVPVLCLPGWGLASMGVWEGSQAQTMWMRKGFGTRTVTATYYLQEQFSWRSNVCVLFTVFACPVYVKVFCSACPRAGSTLNGVTMDEGEC
jgi:hypothetical protein